MIRHESAAGHVPGRTRRESRWRKFSSKTLSYYYRPIRPRLGRGPGTFVHARRAFPRSAIVAFCEVRETFYRPKENREKRQVIIQVYTPDVRKCFIIHTAGLPEVFRYTLSTTPSSVPPTLPSINRYVHAEKPLRPRRETLRAWNREGCILFYFYILSVATDVWIVYLQRCFSFPKKLYSERWNCSSDLFFIYTRSLRKRVVPPRWYSIWIVFKRDQSAKESKSVLNCLKLSKRHLNG